MRVSFSRRSLSLFDRDDRVLEREASSDWIVFSYSNTTDSTASAKELDRFSLSSAESPIASLSIGVSVSSLSRALVISEINLA